MEQEHHNEWYGLSLRAYDALRKGSGLEGVGIGRILQVVEKPSFKPALSWEIFEQNSRSESATHFAVRLRWRSDLDSKKFQNPVESLKHPRTLDPTIETHRVELNARLAAEACLKLSQIAVPAYAKAETIGCDGTSYEFAFGDDFLGARFSWWEKPSGHMKLLAEEVQRILKELEAL